MRAFDLQDIYAVIGIGLLCFGLWRIYPPLAILLVGAVFLKMASSKAK